ncbi:MAG TPA: class I SAM-dependent methyltransferase [Solirubrobacterales bacterium]|nr:class I SAM-dependent methyltransferase [Solirubrobacterales bacterium]
MSAVSTNGRGAAAVSCPGCAATQDNAAVLLRGRDRLTGAPGDFEVVACSECGLAFTEPRLRPEDFAIYYPENYSAYVPRARVRGLSLGKRLDVVRLEAIVRYGPYRKVLQRPPGRLLDVGCGTGDLAAVFMRHGWQASGIEPSEQAVRFAREAGVDAVNGTLADAPWEDGHFDAIVFNHSLEHIDKPADALAEAARLLRPGGLLAVAVPNFGSWHRRLFGSAWLQLDLPRHLQHFDRDSLGGLVRRSGLRPLAFEAISMRPSPLGSLQYAIFGEMRTEGRAFQIGAWLLAPLLFLSDRIAEGDCLHVIAER